MSKQSPKRQRVANDQLEVLDELSVDDFGTFIREYSQYIPYKKLWQVIGRNKQLIFQFNEYTTDLWWRKRVKNDFYDYYDAVVVLKTKTIKEDIQEWMRTAIKTTESAWNKPWKLVYMSCYGIITLIDASKSPFKSQKKFVLRDAIIRKDIPFWITNIVLGEFLIEKTSLSCRIKSWVSKGFKKRIDMNTNTNTTWITGIKNGIIIYNENGMTMYDRKTDIITNSTKWSFGRSPRSLSLSSLIYDSNGHYVFPIEDLSSKLNVRPPVRIMGQNYYMEENSIFQYPHILVQKLGVGAINREYFIGGPFNFHLEKFVTASVFVHVTHNEKVQSPQINLNGYTFQLEGGYMQQFCYGMLYRATYETAILAPSGRSIIFEHYKNDFIQEICGPFILAHLPSKWRVIDLWSTLQQEMKEPFGFVSDEHCHNCGFIAQIECKDCRHSFCGKQCAKEHFQNPVRPIACNHGVE